MTDAEFCEIEHSLVSGSRMILERIEKAARADEKNEIALCTIGEYTDIMKDVSEIVMNMSKANHLRSEHSTKMV